jgi:4-amino-4-deoxy-L-arabinose transferase-like glycosyltransferase
MRCCVHVATRHVVTHDARANGMTRTREQRRSDARKEAWTPERVDVLGLRDRSVRWLVVFTFALQLVALWHLDGYQLADSIEYLELAELYAEGHSFSASGSRSFAFPGLFLPLVLLSKAFGLSDPGWVVLLARCLVAVLGATTVLVTARLGAALAGRSAGLVAGFLYACTPVFLQYSISPLTASPVALLVLLGIEALNDRPGWRSGLRAGFSMGAALTIAFKVIPLIGVALVMVLLRDRRRLGTALGLLTTLCLFALGQCLLDLWVYEDFGLSLRSYVISNAVPIMASPVYKLGEATGIDTLKDLGRWIYGWQEAVVVSEGSGGPLRSKTEQTWYLQHLRTHLIPLPYLLLLAAAPFVAARRRSWLAMLLLAEVLSHVALTSVKGSKDFRLWSPILPMVAVLGGLGYSGLRGLGQAPLLRRMVALVPVAATLPLALGILFSDLPGSNMRKYGAWWRAMETVNAATVNTDRPVTVAAAYHWAIRWRGAPHVEEVKLPFALDRWPVLGEQERLEVLDLLNRIDWFIGHVQSFRQDPRLVEVLNRRYEVAQVLWDPELFEELEPVFVFRVRGAGRPDELPRTLYEVWTDEEAAEVKQRLAGRPSLAFGDPGGGAPAMRLLDWELAPAPGNTDLSWLTLTWEAGPGLEGRNLRTVVRIEDRVGHVWQRNLVPGWGGHPLGGWEPGMIVRDSTLVAVPQHPATFAGAWARGREIPVRLWISVPGYEEDEHGVPYEVAGLLPLLPSGEPFPVDPAAPQDWRGARNFSQDGLVQVGGAFMPVHPRSRLRDDGLPLEDAGRVNP